VSNDSIADMTGKEKFVSLETLKCDRNQLITLDISNNTDLEYLSCGWNQLTTLDISKNPALKYLYCGNNRLTTLDVSNKSNLEYLSFGSNYDLPSIDVSGNTQQQDVIGMHFWLEKKPDNQW
jgi:Leucine-rich repeat (LRR) protein